jgi:hypothetical protein
LKNNHSVKQPTNRSTKQQSINQPAIQTNEVTTLPKNNREIRQIIMKPANYMDNHPGSVQITHKIDHPKRQQKKSPKKNDESLSYQKTP